MGVRVYDTQLRQFLQPDPIDPMTYTYVGGDPLNRIDPTGMVSEAVDPPMPRSDAEVMLFTGEGWQGYAAPLVYSILYRTQLDRLASNQALRSESPRFNPRYPESFFLAETPGWYFDFSEQAIPGWGAEMALTGRRSPAKQYEPFGSRFNPRLKSYILVGGGSTLGMLSAPSFFGDVVRSFKETLTKGPVGYRDLNIALGSPILAGVLIGIVTDAQTGRHHLEFGVGFMNPGLGLTLTGSAQGITPGGNIAFQLNVGSLAGQTGIDSGGNIYSEFGGNMTGFPGASLTGYWVTDWSF